MPTRPSVVCAAASLSAAVNVFKILNNQMQTIVKQHFRQLLLGKNVEATHRQGKMEPASCAAPPT